MMELNTILSDHIIQALGWTIVHSIWQAALIGLALFLILPFLQRQEAQTRYSVAFSSLLLIFAISLSTFLYYLQTGNAIDTDFQSLKNASIPQHINVLLGQNQLWSSYIENNLDIISGIWIIGMLLYTLKFGAGYYKIRRFKTQVVPSNNPRINVLFDKLVKQFKINEKLRLELTNNFAGPFVSGWLKPIIYFPFSLACQLTEEQLEDILAHEISHIVRGDFLMNIIQIFIENLFYYHPAMWWISSTIRKERELACDELALNMSRTNRIRYAGSLLSLGEYTARKTPSLGLSAKGYKNDLFNRVSNLLGEKQINNPVRQKIMISSLIIGIMALVLSFRGPIDQRIHTGQTHLMEVEITSDTLFDQHSISANIQLIKAADNQLIQPESNEYELVIEDKIDHAENIDTMFNDYKDDHHENEKTYNISILQSDNQDLAFIEGNEPANWSQRIKLRYSDDEEFSDEENNVFYLKIDTLEHLVGDFENRFEILEFPNEITDSEAFLIENEKSKIDLNDQSNEILKIEKESEIENLLFEYLLASDQKLEKLDLITQQNELEAKIHELNSIKLAFSKPKTTFHFRPNLSSKDVIPNIESKVYVSKHFNFNDLVWKEMKRDGLLKEGSNTIEISGESMKINGVKVSESVYHKYKNKYKNFPNYKMGSKSMLKLKTEINESNILF